MKIGLSASSNGHGKEHANQIYELISVFNSLGMEPVIVEHFIKDTDEFAANDKERATELMKLYEDDKIGDIYDISGGGDLANGVLEYLDFDVIARSDKTFWGYSDLTTVINAIFTITGKSSIFYQVKNLVYKESVLQRKRFKTFLAGDDSGLFGVKYNFLQGERMEGVVIGGNIRCFTKLAGTRYWLDVKGKILFLESYGGGTGQIATLFTQLEQIEVFEQVTGVLLGTFTEYDEEKLTSSAYELLKMHISETLPVACTRDIGHRSDSKAITIGKIIKLQKIEENTHAFSNN